MAQWVSWASFSPIFEFNCTLELVVFAAVVFNCSEIFFRFSLVLFHSSFLSLYDWAASRIVWILGSSFNSELYFHKKCCIRFAGLFCTLYRFRCEKHRQIDCLIKECKKVLMKNRAANGLLLSISSFFTLLAQVLCIDTMLEFELRESATRGGFLICSCVVK